MTENNRDVFFSLQDWYYEQCNGSWEKKFGIRIGTIDNPGWSIRIDLTETDLENKFFEDLKVDISNDNWFLIWVKEKKLQGGGAPENLIDLIKNFLILANKSPSSMDFQKNNLIMRLQKWYQSQCDGDWEHEYGVDISTTDKPGWLIQVDLVDTSLIDKAFKKICLDFSLESWVHCSVSEDKFQASGGPMNLVDIIKIFIEWVES